ncbi:MAG: polyribonucleotide nucleotidyltransferase [Candidatus Cloacimonetes bacterium]|nr:polyribonucleotide nucleotidyltransferase [Candidatus Cloacimonadota bacterium]
MQQHAFKVFKKSVEIGGKTITIETGKIAKQANGSVIITCGQTVLLCTAVMGKLGKEMTDFFPLTVDYIEKMYASGKIPGGFFKREAKPSTNATLISRLIDRSIRPLFPDGFRNPVHVVLSPLSYDGINDPAPLGIIAASIALSISDIPFNGPIAGVTVGLINNEFIINPTIEELETSLLNLNVGGSESSVVMIEAGAKDVTEAKMLEAVYFGHDFIKMLCQMQSEFAKDAGKSKVEVILDKIPDDIIKPMEESYGLTINETMQVKGKHDRQNAIDALSERIVLETAEKLGEEEFAKNERYIKQAIEELIKKYVRQTILYEQNRADGRGVDDIRDISIEIDYLPIVHGSALFTRGETQALGCVTLGTADDEQIIDGLDEEYKKTFFLHYNFPPFSVGETGRMGSPGRRELGHGALAERGLEYIIPSKDIFPYTIRIVSEILESNGSSSMATACVGCLALMAAGVPIKAPVAGIANGLIMEGDKFIVLTDIQGLEDHLGDMDFKVTGTKNGITAMQMDIKIEGITKEIMTIALQKARMSINTILGYMEQVITEPRKELADNVPKIETLQVDPTRLGEIIGASGKIIKAIIEETKTSINIEDTGLVSIASAETNMINRAKELILSIITEPSTSEWYNGVVSRIETFGVFVKFMNGYKEGMAHVSGLPVPRGENVSDHFKVGDPIRVRLTESDKPGKLALSTREFGDDPAPRTASFDRDRDRGYDRGPRRDGDRGRSGDRDRRDGFNKKRY